MILSSPSKTQQLDLVSTTKCEYQSQRNQNLEQIGQKSIEIAWAAGLFEGEGCIATDRNSRRLIIEMTDKDVMEDFVRIVGYGNLCGPHNTQKKDGIKRKPTYRWSVCKRTEVSRILQLFLPFLGKRRTKKAVNVLNHYENLS